MSASAQEVSPTLRVTIDDALVIEGDNGNTTAAFNIRAEGHLIEPVTLRFSTANCTVTAAVDYISQEGRIVLEPGVSESVISISADGRLTGTA